MTTILVFLLCIAPQWTPQVKADQGSAKVYILKLSGVGASWVDDPSKAVEGAIEACTPRERYDNIPRAHPKYGETAPYYDISYQVVTEWSTYVNIIQNEVGVIIVNTHGEILPRPSGYSNTEWVEAIADAMINRRVTWAHMAGYPFYYVWHQGASQKTVWGVDGFKALMSHIGLDNVELPLDTLPSYKTDLTDSATQILATKSWNLDDAKKVLLKRPLQKSVFKDYCALPIYQIGPIDGEIYWEGAIIDFAKPSERLDLEETHGFGAFVHLGTNQTYIGGPGEEATDSDKWRAYVATAAAIWIETARFKGACDVASNVYTEEYTGLRVAPIIADQWFDTETQELVVRIGFGIYGAVKAPETGSYHYIDSGKSVGFQVNGPTVDWRFWAKLDASKNGRLFESTIEDLWSTGKLAASTALWIAPWFFPGAGPIFSTLGGVILLSNWAQTLSGRYEEYRGVTEKDTLVHFYYQPDITRTTVGGYRHEECQSMIYVDVYIPKGEITDWRVIPMDFWVKLFTTDWLDAEVKADISLVVWLDDTDEVSVFFEDFGDGMNGWSSEDRNPSAGLDYWGVSNITRVCGQAAWCAQVGTNSLKEEIPNTEAEEYDDSMDAWLMLDVDLRPYQWANLSYYIDNWITDADDYLGLHYALGHNWKPLGKTYTGWDEFWDSVLVPTNATKIGFRFYSNDDSDVWRGAFVDNVEIRSKLHNDAPYQNTDAAGFDNPNSITVSESWTNYAGYLGVLDDIEDWYIFDASSGRLIEAELTSPPEADFKMELYDKYGDKKAGPGDVIGYQLLPDAPLDNWRIKIYTESGSGQYDFNVRARPTGGGCPYLYTLGGTEFLIDNNLLPSSEVNQGTDVEDYYRLQRALVPTYQGRWFSHYSLQIREFENEHSYIDKVRFYAVDHSSDVKVAVTPYGEILTYSNPVPPISAVDDDGVDVLSLLSSVDGDYYQGCNGSYVTMTFASTDISNGAKLVIRDDWPPDFVKCPVHVQVLNTTGKWDTVAVFNTRVHWATDIINMTGYWPDAEGRLRVRLCFVSEDKLDYVGLDTTPQEDITITKAVAVSAIHSTHGYVTFRLLLNDQVYAELVPGEQIQLKFILPNNKEETRTFILYIEGHYVSIND